MTDHEFFKLLMISFFYLGLYTVPTILKYVIFYIVEIEIKIISNAEAHSVQ